MSLVEVSFMLNSDATRVGAPAYMNARVRPMTSFAALLLAESRSFLAGRFVADEALGRAGNLPFSVCRAAIALS